MRFATREVSNILIILSALVFIYACSHQDKNPDNVQRALKSERAEFHTNLVENTIKKPLSNSLADSNASAWQGAIWGMQLAQYRLDSIDQAIQNAVANLENYNPLLQRSLLEVAYSMYPGEVRSKVRAKLSQFDNEKVFAMAVEYLALDAYPDSLKHFSGLLKTQFTNWETHPILYMLSKRLSLLTGIKRSNLPSLSELLSHSFGDNTIAVFSFYRFNRDYIGLTIIRDSNGKFLKTGEGELLAIPQFARSVTNLPSYLTNGNTPQGIYSIQGFDISGNVFIGPTQNIQTRLPYEAAANEFIHDRNITGEWSIQLYEALLPESWQNYFPIYEAYYAGQAGRSEIIAHGTTINPDYYKSFSFYPYTPSLGCMTTKEIWSDKTGYLVESDQLKLVNAIKSLKSTKGYWVVIELDDEPENVKIEEILLYLSK